MAVLFFATAFLLVIWRGPLVDMIRARRLGLDEFMERSWREMGELIERSRRDRELSPRSLRAERWRRGAAYFRLREERRRRAQVFDLYR